jgi:hypothetical protein
LNLPTVTDFDDGYKTINKKLEGDWYDGMTDEEGNFLEKPKFARDAYCLARKLQLKKFTFNGRV